MNMCAFLCNTQWMYMYSITLPDKAFR